MERLPVGSVVVERIVVVSVVVVAVVVLAVDSNKVVNLNIYNYFLARVSLE